MNDGDSSLTPIDLGASYRVLCEACGVLEFSDRTRLILSGDDRQSFLHNLCTNDIKKLSRGQGCEAFITNVQGKCLGFVTVLNADDEVIVETVPQQADLLLSHFDRYLITEDVELEDVGSRTCELMVVGPGAVHPSGAQQACPVARKKNETITSKIQKFSSLFCFVSAFHHWPGRK